MQDPRIHAATPANLDLILNRTYWWPAGESGLYRPVTTLSYLFNYAVLGNGDRPAGYHIVNLALHVANVLLAYLLLLRLTTSTTALIAAGVWAVHPLSTEAVTNIVGRADLLAALAVFGALWMYARSGEAGARRVVWLTALAFLTVLGGLAKESAIVIAPVVVAYAICLQPRRALAGPIVAVTVALVAVWLQRSAILGSSPPPAFPFVDNPIVGAGFWAGRATAVAVMARYGSLIVWPMRLSADYSYAQIPLVTGRFTDWAAILSVVLVAALAVIVARRERALVFLGIFAALTFLPASNLLFPAGTIMAERVMYLPSLGIIGFCCATLTAHVSARSRRRIETALIVLAGALVMAFTVRTWIRNRDWRNDVTLWSSAVQSVPRSFKAHRGLAEASYLEDAGANMSHVVTEIDAAVSILDPLPDGLNDARTYRQAAAYHLVRGDPQRTIALLQRCLAIVGADTGAGPAARTAASADAYRILSAAYARLERGGEAVEAANRARDLEPSNPLSYRQSTAAFLAADRGDEAAAALMTGSLVTGDHALGDELMDLYRRGLDPAGCAVVSTANGPALNPSCATVKRHMCAAAADAAALYRRTGRTADAEQIVRTVQQQFACP